MRKSVPLGLHRFFHGSGRKARRAAFPIIGGLIIFGILFTAVLGYYYTTNAFQQNYQNAVKNEQENLIQSSSQNLIVTGSLSSTQKLDFQLNNTGSSVSVVAYWIFNGTSGSVVQYENTTTMSSCRSPNTCLPLYVGQGGSVTYTNTNISVTNVYQQYVIKVVTSQGGVFSGTFPSEQLSSGSINSLVSGGIGSLRMSFSSFSWYGYVTGPGPYDTDGDFQQQCYNGQQCSTIDGSAYNSRSCTSNTCKLTLTTSDSNDVIILTSYEASSSVHISSISDQAGLTWHMRKQLSNSQQNSMTEEWYAVAPNPLSSDTVTVTYTASVNAGITAFGIFGANTNSIFDSSSPVTATGYSTRPSASISTSNANDIIIGMASCTTTGTISTYGGGYGYGNQWTQAAGPTNPQCSGNMAIPEYQYVSSIQNGLAVGFRINEQNGQPTPYWSEIVDAIKVGSWKIDISDPHPGTLVPQGQNSTGDYCGYCGTMVPIAFSVNITNYDPSQAALVINSQANLWIIETCDTATFANNCPQGNPVYVFYIMGVNSTTGEITTTTQGSFSQITIPYGATQTLYFGAAYPLSRDSFQSMSLSSDDSIYAGNNLAYYGEFAVFILFSGTKIPPANIQVYGQNIPFQTTISSDNLGWYFESPNVCQSGSATSFTLQVNNSVFSGYPVNQIAINASSLTSVSAKSPPGWSATVSNGLITWTNTNTNDLLEPGGTLTFTWKGTSPPVNSTTEITFPMTISWNGGGFQNLQGATACYD